MLSTVAAELARQGLDANRDRIAWPVLRWFRRCPETFEADEHDTSLPRAGENAADLSRRGPHRGSGRWS
jgi:hypothetical protein